MCRYLLSYGARVTPVQVTPESHAVAADVGHHVWAGLDYCLAHLVD